MGRAPCCDKANVKKGPWSPEEDLKLKEYIDKYGTGGNWISLPQKVGLKRCGKSCRLRWLNYLRPNIKHGEFSDAEDRIICTLFATIGSRWSIIASQLPGRTDNDIKNYWNTKLKKKLMWFSPLLLSSATAQPVSSKQQINNHNYQSAVTTTTFTASPPSSDYCVSSSPLSVATAARSCFSSGLDPVSSSDLPSPPPYAFQPMRETLLMNNTCSFQFQQPYPPEAANLVKENNNFLMFGAGGHEASSCSSSDGSSVNLLMSHGNKDRDFDYGSEQQQHQHQQQLGLGFQSCINYQNNNGEGGEENNKLTTMMMMMAMAGDNTESEWTGNDEKPSEIWSEINPGSLEYYGNIEEIKQLLISNNNRSSVIRADEIKTEEKEEERIAMYY